MSLIALAIVALTQDASTACRPGIGGPLLAAPACRRASVVPASEGDGAIGEATWVRSLQTYYPDAALQNGAPRGRVVLLCNQSPGGRLSGCVVEEETPAGLGFGAAALTAARHGQTTGGAPRVRFTVTFTP